MNYLHKQCECDLSNNAQWRGYDAHAMLAWPHELRCAVVGVACGVQHVLMPSMSLMCACRSVCGHLPMVHILNMVRHSSCASAMPSGQNTRLLDLCSGMHA